MATACRYVCHINITCLKIKHQVVLLLAGGVFIATCYQGAIRVLRWRAYCVPRYRSFINLLHMVWATVWTRGQGRVAALDAPSLPSQSEHYSTLVQSFTSVTGDVARAAMILEEFFEQQQEGCNLTSQLQQFLAEKAGAASTAVEKQLDNVLWWYSMLWFPLMLVMFIIWATSRSTAHDKHTIDKHTIISAPEKIMAAPEATPGIVSSSTSSVLTRRPSSAASNSSKLAAGRLSQH